MQNSQHSGSVDGSVTPWLGAQIQKIIEGIHNKYKDVNDGAVATYIPELGKADAKKFGICLATVEGEVFTAGDWDTEFTIQSMCKPFAFQLAMERHGTEETLKRVGVEPSGEAFNSIEFDQKTGRPFNPMVNAGAIAVSSLIKQQPVQAGIGRSLTGWPKRRDAGCASITLCWPQKPRREIAIGRLRTCF